jgi:hypothetical protein
LSPDVAALLMLKSASEMKPHGGGSEPSGQPQPLYDIQAPPISCSIIDSGVPLSLSRALRVGRSIASKVVSGR